MLDVLTRYLRSYRRYIEYFYYIVVPEPRSDLPRVEPYAVGRWKPNEAGLYAQADLYPSGI